MVEKSSIHRSSHPIPSIEFSPTNSPLDEGNLFVHSNPLEKVHIVYISVAKLSLVERLVLPHLLGAMDGNVIVICGHRNAIVCKIADQPPPPSVSCGDGTKEEHRTELCDMLSLECEPEPGLDGPDESTCGLLILHNTCNNTQRKVPITLGVSVSVSRTAGRKQKVV
jgi:hypothetical protein